MSIILAKEGLFTSLQDLGRYGSQRFGINPRGAMDRAALRILNALLGNDDSAPALECHFPGPELEFRTASRFAVGGADLGPCLNGLSIGLFRVADAVPGDVLTFQRRRRGTRAYVAVEGGLRSGSHTESRALSTGRLGRGQVVEFADLRSAACGPFGAWASPSLCPAYSHFPTVRVIAGPEFDLLTDESRKGFLDSAFTLSLDSDRMGFRLQGPRLRLAEQLELASAAVAFGTVQLLPDGQLIVLMADHQTTGGYPRLGTVAAADLPLLGQLGPGDRFAFAKASVAEAEAAIVRFERDLGRLRVGLKLLHSPSPPRRRD